MANPVNATVGMGYKAASLKEAGELEFLRWLYWNMDSEERAKMEQTFTQEKQAAIPQVQLI